MQILMGSVVAFVAYLVVAEVLQYARLRDLKREAGLRLQHSGSVLPISDRDLFPGHRDESQN